MHADIAGTIFGVHGTRVTAGTLSARYDRLGNAVAGVASAATTPWTGEPVPETAPTACWGGASDARYHLFCKQDIHAMPCPMPESVEQVVGSLCWIHRKATGFTPPAAPVDQRAHVSPRQWR